MAGGGMVFYVNERRKEKEEIRKKNSSKAAGRADMGGPFHLIDHRIGKPLHDVQHPSQLCFIV